VCYQDVGVTNMGFMGDNFAQIAMPERNSKISCVVLDLSAMSSIDPSGVDKIKALAGEYRHVDITVCIAGGSGMQSFETRRA
jgi:hypothetical protein